VNTKLLIDAIVHQTTVLIAQLSTASGIRAPLSHVADQVFLELSRAIEAQGVSRKVVADMFGLAIRTYQKKVQRLTESVTLRDQTLWQAALERIAEGGGAARRELLAHFHGDDPVVVGSVLSDLVSSGLVVKTGFGEREWIHADSWPSLPAAILAWGPGRQPGCWPMARASSAWTWRASRWPAPSSFIATWPTVQA